MGLDMDDKLTHIKDLLHRPPAEISKEVKSVATYYPDMVKVYVPNNPIVKKISTDWEIDSKTHRYVDKVEKTSNETPEERSIRRTQKLVRDYIMCNRFDIFFTITIASDRYNIERSRKKLYNWIKNQRDRNGRFEYIIVSEYHKDGALHFHGVARNYTGSLKESRSSKTNRLLTDHGKPVYEFSEYKSGFTKVQYIGSTSEDHARVAKYISKYITKNMVSIFGKKRFWASQGLKKPILENNPAWFQELEPDYMYENDYGKIYTYTNLWKYVVPEEIRSKNRFI